MLHEPEPIHDRRDVLGTLAPDVVGWARTELEHLAVTAAGGQFTANEAACSAVLGAAIDHLEGCVPSDGSPQSPGALAAGGLCGIPDGRRVLLSRDLAERLLAGLRASETSRGHLAQRVMHEGLGYCGWRSESPRCVEHKALVAELVAALEG